MQPTTVNIAMDKPNLNAMINEDRIEEEDKQAGNYSISFNEKSIFRGSLRNSKPF